MEDIKQYFQVVVVVMLVKVKHSKQYNVKILLTKALVFMITPHDFKTQLKVRISKHLFGTAHIHIYYLAGTFSDINKMSI